MRNEKVIFETDDKVWRILEIRDADFSLENLKGDCYNPIHNPDIDPEELAKQEKDFENLVDREGVYGYVLEKWDSRPGQGYEHIDSCWGFVGSYNPKVEMFNHYIVDDLKEQIK